jgi:hypothetical protein
MPSRSVERNGEVESREVRSAIAMWVGFGLLLAACGGESAWVPASGPTQGAFGPRGVWVEQASETSPPEILSTARPSVGPRPHIFMGRTLGYELTSQSPGTYRFRWTSDNLVNHTGVRRFTGSVWTPGHFLSVVPGCEDASCPLEDDDYLSAVQSVASGGERIDWDTLAKDAWDGFSFTTDNAPVYFDLNVNGQARPELLELLTWTGPYAR